MTIPRDSRRRVQESTAEDDDPDSPKCEIIHIAHLKTMHHRFLEMRSSAF